MRVPDNIRDCCCFVYANVEGKHKLIGTGFFIGEKYEEEGIEKFKWIDFVTAKHIVMEARKEARVLALGIRINAKSGNTVDIDIPDEAWFFHPIDESVDAVIAYISGISGLDIKVLPTEMVMNSKIIRNYDIGIGDEVCITGLFYKHYGSKRNLPIVRTGNIAMMPLEPVKTRSGSAEAYLVELRSIGGLSGSPVFVHTERVKGSKHEHTLSWMGLMRGHWEIDEDSINMLDSTSEQQLNVGIGVVVPAYKIMEISKQESVMRIKEMEEKKRIESFKVKGGKKMAFEDFKQ